MAWNMTNVSMYGEQFNELLEAIREGGATPTASSVPYDNTTSGYTATNVQGAIDESANKIGELIQSLSTLTSAVNKCTPYVIHNGTQTIPAGKTMTTITPIPSGYAWIEVQYYGYNGYRRSCRLPIGSTNLPVDKSNTEVSYINCAMDGTTRICTITNYTGINVYITRILAWKQ